MDRNDRSWERWNDPVLIERLQDDWAKEKFDSTFGYLREAIEQFKPKGCLDVGCGTGRYYPIIAQYGVDYRGVDSSEEMLAAARQRFPAGLFQRGDAYRLGWDDATFDLVVCSDVLVHIPRHMVALRELARVTRKVLFLRISTATPERTTVTVDPKLGFLNVWYQVEEIIQAIYEVGFSKVYVREIAEDEMGPGLLEKVAPELTLPERDRRQVFVAVK